MTAGGLIFCNKTHSVACTNSPQISQIFILQGSRKWGVAAPEQWLKVSTKSRVRVVAPGAR